VTGTWRLPPAPAARNEIEFYLSPKMEGLEVQLLEPKGSAPLNLQSTRRKAETRNWISSRGCQFQPRSPYCCRSHTLQTANLLRSSTSVRKVLCRRRGATWYPQAAYKNRETGTLHFTVPGGEQVISNGALQSSRSRKRGANRLRCHSAFKVRIR